jgi:gas vesicle protein
MKFFVGLLIGLGLGVLVGLLIAPQSGEETRSQLGEQGVVVRTGKLFDQIRTRAQEGLAQGREAYSHAKSEVSQSYRRAKSGQL